MNRAEAIREPLWELGFCAFRTQAITHPRNWISFKPLQRYCREAPGSVTALLRVLPRRARTRVLEPRFPKCHFSSWSGNLVPSRRGNGSQLRGPKRICIASPREERNLSQGFQSSFRTGQPGTTIFDPSNSSVPRRKTPGGPLQIARRWRDGSGCGDSFSPRSSSPRPGV